MLFHVKRAVTPFFHLPVYCSEAHTDTQNTSTTLSTTGMHEEVLHILNNDHTFDITDKRKSWALQTYIQKHTFRKTVHLYCEEGDWSRHRKRNIL